MPGVRDALRVPNQRLHRTVAAQPPVAPRLPVIRGAVGQIRTMKTEQTTRLKSAFLWFGIGAVTISAALLTSIFRSTSSTAGIGILFIPFNAAPLSLPFFIFGYCLSDLIKWIKRKSAKLSMSEKFHASIALVTAILMGVINGGQA